MILHGTLWIFFAVLHKFCYFINLSYLHGYNHLPVYHIFFQEGRGWVLFYVYRRPDYSFTNDDCELALFCYCYFKDLSETADCCCLGAIVCLFLSFFPPPPPPQLKFPSNFSLLCVKLFRWKDALDSNVLCVYFWN